MHRIRSRARNSNSNSNSNRVRNRVRVRFAAGLVCAALLALSTPARADAGAGDIPRLTDEHGRVLTLRGWNIEDKAHRGDQALSAITEKHLRDMRAQGFGFARLLVFWDDLEPRPGRYSQEYLRKVERILDWAHRYDIRVVIDAHQDVFGPAFGHRGIPEWATRTDGLPFTPHPGDWFAEYFEPAVQRAFTHLYEDEDLRRAQERMWRVLADRFEDHPAVLGYDLVNEPMGELGDGEDLPAAARRIEAEQLTPMYNRLADAIRTVDDDTWLFVEPTPIVGEGVPTGLGRIEDPKVVYAPHFYNAAMEAGADYEPDAGWIESYEAAVTVYPREYRVPVVVGEWGPLDSSLPNMGRFYREALDSLARYSSGWAGYVWCYGGGYCAVDRSGALRTNKELTAAPYAPAVAGRVRAESRTPDGVPGDGRDAYRLAWTAGRGVTELSLPPSATGWRVEVSGRAWPRTRVVAPGGAVRVPVRAVPGAEVTLRVNRG
ncbi:glycoside hydrolase family 5 protein [Streptomyces sp. SP18CS02]|uniref:glycoside hydrolase family 5 protein n=1 Tax=Streptomyces sp. SP18CS02 TaxID=3002531 RepID=UPI002E79104C|nr:cellulase family glycosylhydrolase [Streptomyces sp. SP18CS02]MEE1757264.1 cellulase family glycosylhydrolase [Streptomyces sp. SP18CS02]